MRRALGLDDAMPRPRSEPERAEPTLSRPLDRFAPTQRRRFVQDGEVPVTVIRRDAPDGFAARQGTGVPMAGGAAGPTASRLQRAETALAAESAARERAERALNEAQATIRDLQTKLGHADLAKNEVLEQVRREREGIAGLRAAVQEQTALRQEVEARARAAERQVAALQAEIAEERAARKDAEKALRLAEEARESAERLVQVLTEEAAAAASPAATPTTRRGGASASARSKAAAADEPEPVKWWLPQPKTSTRRRGG